MKPWLHTGYPRAVPGRDRHSQAALQVPCPIRPWRREVCTKYEIILPGNEGSFPGLTSEWDP